MKCAIMQPTFLPWLGYFDLIDQADIFVFFDDVQLTKRSWQVRNRIKTKNGELYLTVPIKKTGIRDEILICKALISYDEQWQDKILKSVSNNYSKAPFFRDVFIFLSEILSDKHETLSNLNTTIITGISQKIGLETEFIYSSRLNGIEGKKDTRLVNICKAIDADQYISPQSSSIYIEVEKPGGIFNENNITLIYQEYLHPIYRQLHGEFIPYMSIIDLLFNYGFHESCNVIRTGNRKINIYPNG
jgi:hypothetical protein